MFFTGLRNPFSGSDDLTMHVLTREKAAPLAIYLLACMAGLFLVLAQTDHIRNSERYKEYGSEQPLLTNFDGYYFLRIAEQLGGEEGLAKFGLPKPVPLLSRFTNSLSRVTGISHKSLAFYMPPVLATLSLVVFLLWANALGGHVASLVTLLFLVTSPYWGVRTSLGIYDTDSLIPFFIYGFALCLYRYTVVLTPWRLAWLALAAVLGWVSVLWWRPSLFICAAVAGIYPLTVFMKTARWERLLKIVLLAGLVAGCVLVFLPKGQSLLPGFVQEQAGYLRGHVQLLLRDKAQSGFAEVGSTINELKGQSLQVLAFRTHALPWFLYVSLAGMAVLAWKRRVAFCYLLPFLGLGLLSLQNIRFTLLFLPLSMLAMGIAADTLYAWARERWPSRGKTVRIAAAALGVTLATVLMVKAAGITFEPGMTRVHDYLAKQARDHSPDNALVWSWWDDGYFWQYVAQRRTFFDGGSQSSLNMFVVGYGLRAEDPLLARNWMRFFAAHGSRALYTVQAGLGSMSKGIQFLEDIFSDPESLDQRLEQLGDARRFSPNPRDYFFPRTEVCLILPLDIFQDSHTWYFYGTPALFLERTVKRQRLFDTFEKSSTFLDPTGVFHAPRKNYRISHRVLYQEPGNRTLTDISPNKGTHLLLESERLSSYWVADERLTRTVAFKLAFPLGDHGMGEHFKQVASLIGVGGVWMVK